jgi:hypothetical protein
VWRELRRVVVGTEEIRGTRVAGRRRRGSAKVRRELVHQQRQLSGLLLECLQNRVFGKHGSIAAATVDGDMRRECYVGENIL